MSKFFYQKISLYEVLLLFKQKNNESYNRFL